MSATRDQRVKALLKEMNSQLSLPDPRVPDTRSDNQVQQTSSDSSEIQEVVSNVRMHGGDTKWIEDGAIMTYTSNKTSFFHILDYLDDNDNVYDYEIQVIETQHNGVTVDITDEIDIDDIRDTQNIHFKVLVFMDPEIVEFDPVYVDADEINDRNGDFDISNDTVTTYIRENLSHIEEVITWQGDMNESFILISEKDGSSELHLIPPTPVADKASSNITKFNIDSIANNSTFKKFQDMGYTITNKGKIVDIDYEMDGDPEEVMIFHVKDGNTNHDVIDALVIENLITEATVHSTETLTEIRKKIKVNSKGTKRIKMQCQKGFKYNSNRRICVKITGSDMMNMKRSHIKASRTKKAAGQGFEMRKQRKTKKALRFRKSMGIKTSKVG